MHAQLLHRHCGRLTTMSEDRKRLRAAQGNPANRWQSEYDAEMRRQRRDKRLGCVVMFLSAATMVFFGWLAMVGAVALLGD